MNDGRRSYAFTRAHEEFLVVNETAAGFRVYPAAEPSAEHLVQEYGNRFQCTCDLFAQEETCEHVRAVLGKLSTDKRLEQEERAAIQHEGREPSKPKMNGATYAESPATMSLKRSISPDGRIDSLSVEFSCSVDHIPSGEITNRAVNMLRLQSTIASTFLKANQPGAPSRNGHSRSRNGESNGFGTVPATMISVGSTRGRYGPRLFIEFNASGKMLKLFGTAQQLADAVNAAGYHCEPHEVAVGSDLNLPCQVVTKPGRDPRYTDIERVLPQNGSNPRRRYD